jgi:hypothetical protein
MTLRFEVGRALCVEAGLRSLSPERTTPRISPTLAPIHLCGPGPSTSCGLTRIQDVIRGQLHVRGISVDFPARTMLIYGHLSPRL